MRKVLVALVVAMMMASAVSVSSAFAKTDVINIVPTPGQQAAVFSGQNDGNPPPEVHMLLGGSCEMNPGSGSPIGTRGCPDGPGAVGR